MNETLDYFSEVSNEFEDGEMISSKDMMFGRNSSKSTVQKSIILSTWDVELGSLLVY